ncbi:MAG TPA: amidase [Bacteroidales bacterium]|nr:amidase [Bacteroidales bacterium]
MKNNYKPFVKALLRICLLILLTVISACKDQTRQTDRISEDFNVIEADIASIQKAYRDGTLTVKELVSIYLDRIEKIDQSGPQLHSIIEVNPDALIIAEELDKELKNGNLRGPMHGIPVVLKDNIDTHDKMPTTAGSRALQNSYPLSDSYIAKKLREAGAVIIGKANLSEWANFRGQLSTSGWSGEGGQTRNPYDLSRNPCGSSSGSAVAVAANLTVIAIGTETNGSIVCPSHSNGIVGIKPTVGLLSRSGVIPISFTQDTPGPMARTVRDAAICLGVLTGVDSSDSKTLASAGKSYSDYTQFLKVDGLKGKRIGLYMGAFGANFKVDSLTSLAVRYMKSQGAEIVEVDQIIDNEAEDASLQVMLFEYKDGLNNYFRSLGENAPVKTVEDLIAFNKTDSVELNYFDQVYLEMANAKEDLNSLEYVNALETMLRMSRDEGIDRIMDKNRLDAIVAPTGTPAWKTDLINGDSFQLGTSSPAALAGYPNICVPMGEISGLPVGISFFGRAWSEPLLIEIAYSYETGTKHRFIPDLTDSQK